MLIVAELLKKNTALKELDLRYNGRFKIINSLSKNKITDKGWEHLAPALAKMTALKTLYLNNNDITDKGCEHLAPALAKMTALEELGLVGNKITDKGKNKMREAWKQAGKSGGLDF